MTNETKNTIPQVFNFDKHEVRTTIQDGQVWFVANDIAEALGYVNAKDALKRHVDNDDRKGVAFHDPLGKNPQTMNTINESGMYSLILSSKKAEAKKFKRWVTSEVLPKIRQTGSYQSNPKTVNINTNNQPTLELNKRKFLKSEDHNNECYFLTSEFANVFELEHNELMDTVSAFSNTYKNNYSAKYLKHELIIFTVRNKKQQALIHHSVFLLFSGHKKEHQQLVVSCVSTIADFYQKQKQELLDQVQQSKDDFNKGSYYIAHAEEIINKNLNSIIDFDTETPTTCLNILEGLKNEMDKTNPQFGIISACEALIKSTITHNTTQFKQIKVMLEQIRSNIDQSEFHLFKIYGDGNATGWMLDEERKKIMLRDLN